MGAIYRTIKEMKTTYCPSAGITRVRFWGRPPDFLENSFGGQSLGYDLSLC